MKAFEFNSDILKNPEQALRYDWLETNGLGGYSSSTPLECHTRKYHGLWSHQWKAAQGVLTFYRRWK